MYVRSGSGVPISLGVNVASGEWRDMEDGSPTTCLGGVAIAVYLASALGVVLAAVEVAATICPESVGVLDDGTGGDE